MTETDPGHEYLLDSLDGDLVQHIVFVKREGALYPGNVGHHPGTTCQEVLRALLARLKYLNEQQPCWEIEAAAGNLENAVYLLELRASRKAGRPAPKYRDAVDGTGKCTKCGHVGCGGSCHG